MLLVASNLRSARITLSYLLTTATVLVCEQPRSATLLACAAEKLPAASRGVARALSAVCELQVAQQGCGWLGASASAALPGSWVNYLKMQLPIV